MMYCITPKRRRAVLLERCWIPPSARTLMRAADGLFDEFTTIPPPLFDVDGLNSVGTVNTASSIEMSESLPPLITIVTIPVLRSIIPSAFPVIPSPKVQEKDCTPPLIVLVAIPFSVCLRC